MVALLYTKSVGRIHLNFSQSYSCGQRQQSVSVGNSRGVERAEKVGATLVRLHGEHQVQTATAAAPATGEEVFNQQVAEIERLEKALKVQRAASAEFEHQAGLCKRKAAEFDAAATKTATAKRVKTAHSKKRCDIDPTNRTPFVEKCVVVAISQQLLFSCNCHVDTFLVFLEFIPGTWI